MELRSQNKNKGVLLTEKVVANSIKEQTQENQSLSQISLLPMRFCMIN